MRLLSIDFDYFLDTDVFVRNNHFPDGTDLKEDCDREWERCYTLYPGIRDIGVTEPEYSRITDIIREHKGLFFHADSHREIVGLFDLLEPGSEVINIDFHHDNYISGGNTPDCANWVRFLKDRYPDCRIRWIKRSDSETASLTGDFPYEMSDECRIEGSFDIIFLCFSPEWSPPHLRPAYEVMAEAYQGEGR